MVKKIKLLALDIDGVLTDGRTTLGALRPERKRLAFQDLDAINAAKRAGLQIALVTGESDGSVDLVAARTGVALVRRGAKDKLAALKGLSRVLHISLAEIAYVGDGDRDAPALARVGFSLAPANATLTAKSAAHQLLPQLGGSGAVNAAVRLILDWNGTESREKLFGRELRKSRPRFKMSTVNLSVCVKMAAELARAVESGRKILLCGEGAPVALAQLLARGFAWPAIALSPRADHSAAQLRALARPGDVIVDFPDVLEAAEIAQDWMRIAAIVEKHLCSTGPVGRRRAIRPA